MMIFGPFYKVNKPTQYLLLLLLLPALMSACRKKGCTDPIASNYSESAQIDDASCEYLDITSELRAEVMQQYADIVYFTYEDCYLEALVMQEKVSSFLESPSQEGLEECREAWMLTRRPFEQAEVFRFYEGPIDGGYSRLSEWMIDPSYIDYVSGDPFSGIIWDSENFKTIDEEELIDANQSEGETKVTIGFHVIEFLLWGEDTASPSQLTPGMRGFNDFAANDSAATDKIRRSQYLEAATSILVADLASLVKDWSSSESGNYRQSFLGMNSTKGFRMILTGMIRSAETELAHNRLRVSLDSLDTEREVSKFSDNTSTDVLMTTIGLRNVFEGKYARVDSSIISGASVLDVASLIDDTLSNEIHDAVNASVKASALIFSPFDYRLSEEFAAESSISNTASELENLSKLLIELGRKLGYEIDPTIRTR